MKVIVSGGGVGGLALAQGLRLSGHDVVVLERGALPTGPSGYRLRLDSRAVSALAAVLPASVYAALLASGPGHATNRRVSYLDRQLRALASAREDDEGVLMIGRGPLLRLLAHGLDDHIHWGAEVRSYRVDGDAVSVELADGTVEHGDAVVAADGMGSPLRRQLLGDDPARSLGICAISGRVPGRARDLDMPGLATALDRNYALASGPRELSVFLADHDPDAGQAVDPAAVAPVPPDREDPYLVWALLGPAEVLPSDEHGPDAMISGVQRLISGWHPELQRLPSLSDPGSVQRYGLYAAPSVPQWPTTAVTLLGDAVHVVPPTGGIGASTAIRDAGHLVDALAELPPDAGRPDLLRAFGAYEQTMRGYADEVVHGSGMPLRWQRRLAAPPVHRGVTTALAGLHRARQVVGR